MKLLTVPTFAPAPYVPGPDSIEFGGPCSKCSTWSYAPSGPRGSTVTRAIECQCGHRWTATIIRGSRT